MGMNKWLLGCFAVASLCLVFGTIGFVSGLAYDNPFNTMIGFINMAIGSVFYGLIFNTITTKEKEPSQEGE